MKLIVILVLLLWKETQPFFMARQAKFGRLCTRVFFNKVRDCDNYGCGGYGAGRRSNGNQRTHEGIDIKCKDGATVRAPFKLTLEGVSVPYRWPAPSPKDQINDGVKIIGAEPKFQDLCVKLFYVKPDQYSGTLEQGARIGVMLNMQDVYPGITSHIHVQMCDKSDPTKYF
ncbi:leukocyte cell-derived chemotaxin-2-like [Engraulis encrasicolus]|uniref:leukocyte cell-derived chemotaxin-2-like n=1 Tax=Engraulis encrasicolus TaxID=184585 RepID=UPI002FD11429